MALDRDGDVVQVQGSGVKPYTLKNVGGTLSCDCPAWRNQGGTVDRRTCKHLKKVRGDAAESARVGGTSASSVAAFSSAGADTSRLSSAVPSAAAPPREEPAVRVAAHVDPSYAADVLARAAADGRKLRQDEKAKLQGPGVILAHPWDGETDPAGWLWSVKLDGCRGYWNGRDFISRQGNTFAAPDWFKAGLPGHPLDGELWMGRQSFQKTMSIVRRLDGGEAWRQIRYVVFDAPHLDRPFEERLAFLESWHRTARPAFAQVHPHAPIRDKEHLRQLLRDAEQNGDEGIMIRKPGSLYEVGRSHTLLKVKPFKDAEGVVIGHEPGKGKHKGRLGGLILRIPSGREFNVGTGFSDDDRRNPPPLGSIVTYTYTELTTDGIPKCAAFLRVRPAE